jgi:DNA-binding NarL/FixJ family response regulator
MHFRIAVRDPLPVYRRGIVALLRDSGFEVEAPDDIIAWIRDDQMRVILLTIFASDDWELLERVLQVRSGTVVLAVLEAAGTDAYVRALRAGASGVIPRDASAGAVREAVVAALNNRCVLPTEVLHALVRPGTAARSEPAASPAELGWLQALARGTTVAQLAATAGYSERMMFRLLRDLYAKIGAENRIGAVMRARDQGWID